MTNCLFQNILLSNRTTPVTILKLLKSAHSEWF